MNDPKNLDNSKCDLFNAEHKSNESLTISPEVGIAQSFDVDLISLIAPTSEARIQKIADGAAGFLYVVSSMGVTGMRSEIKTDLASIIEVVRGSSKVPAAVGFGISTPKQAAEISRIADGVIVGSAIVKLCQQHGEHAAGPIYDYVKSMKEAIQ